MKRLYAAIAAAACGLVIASPAAATTTDACTDFGPGGNFCFAQTVEQNVDFATVRMGRNSFGSYTLVCLKSGDLRIKQDRIPRGGQVSLFPQGIFGFSNPDCVLTAQAVATRGHAARVRVTLVD